MPHGGGTIVVRERERERIGFEKNILGKKRRVIIVVYKETERIFIEESGVSQEKTGRGKGLSSAGH